MCNCNSCILACMPWFCMLSVNEETLFFVNVFQSGNFTPSFFICTPPHLTLLSIYEHQLLLSGIIGSCTWRPFSSAKKFTVVINYQHFTRIHTNNLAQNCERKVFISFHTILHIQPMFVRRCVDENEENFQTLLNSSQQYERWWPKKLQTVICTRDSLSDDAVFPLRSEMGFLIKFPHNRTCRVLIFHRERRQIVSIIRPHFIHIYMFKTFVYVCAT